MYKEERREGAGGGRGQKKQVRGAVVVNYFDKFNLLSSKHLNYLKWREAYKLVIERKHLELTGIEKIKSIKKYYEQKVNRNFWSYKFKS
jgi:primase-polymerase (primpol)-like protein